MVPLYSGVTTSTRSAAATASRSATALAGAVVAVELLVVERDLVEALDDVQDDALGRVGCQVLGDATVEGVGAEAADEDGDTGLG